MTFQHNNHQPLAAAAVPARTWLRTEAVAKTLGVSTMQVTRWARAGTIHATQPGGKCGVWLICPCALGPIDYVPAKPDEAS